MEGQLRIVNGVWRKKWDDRLGGGLLRWMRPLHHKLVPGKMWGKAMNWNGLHHLTGRINDPDVGFCLLLCSKPVMTFFSYKLI